MPPFRGEGSLKFTSLIAVGLIALTGPSWAQGIERPLEGTPSAGPIRGVGPNQGDILFLRGASIEATPMAEWETGKGHPQDFGHFQWAQGADAVAKAPAHASRYEAKTYNFPQGALRVMTYKKGAPALHLLTFESMIHVLQGNVDVDLRKTPVKLKAGDSMFMPAGVMRNAKPSQDIILIQAFVNTTSADPKGAVAHSGDVKQVGPTKRYIFDGNALRRISLKKGAHLQMPKVAAVDVLVYVISGNLRHAQGGQSYEVGPGDAVHIKKGNGSAWDASVDSQMLAVDAPIDPKLYNQTMIAR